MQIINVSETLSPFVFKLMKEHSIKQEWFSVDATKNFNSMWLFKCDVDEHIAKLPEFVSFQFSKKFFDINNDFYLSFRFILYTEKLLLSI